MQLKAEQKLKILANVNEGERHALETLWGIGNAFYAYLFQCFKHSQKEGLGKEYDQLKLQFPMEEEAYRGYFNGNLAGKIEKLLREIDHG